MKLSARVFLLRYYIANFLLTKFAPRLSHINFNVIEKRWAEQISRLDASDTILIVANGPSLLLSDLERLSELPSIGSNKINLIFNKTSWRPSFTTIADPLLIFKMKGSDYHGYNTIFFPDSVRFLVPRSAANLGCSWITSPSVTLDSFVVRDFSSPIRTAHTITASNIQLAIKMGFKRIFVTGLDHSYKEEKSESVKKLVHQSDNHFVPGYRKKGEIVNNAPISKMEADYKFCQQLAKKYGVEILNISRASQLEEFKKVALEDLCL